MPFSYHSHSGQFCYHAKGKLEQVVQEAIRKGFRIYGLSEHMPRFYPSHLYPEEIELSLTPSDLAATYSSFITAARILQQQYRSQITLLVGTEIEYIDRSYSVYIPQLLERYQVDYIIGSLHHTLGIPIDFSQDAYDKALAAHDNDLKKLYMSYFDEQYEMLSLLKPKMVGHFDLIRIFAPRQKDGSEMVISRMDINVWEKVTRNVQCVIGYGGIFEVNSRAWKKGLIDAYPGKEVLKYILSNGGKLTISDDSHGPADVGMHYDKLQNYLMEVGVQRLYYLDYDFESNSVVERVLDNWINDEFWTKMQNW